MGFWRWLFDPRVLVGCFLMVPMYLGFVSRKSYKILLFSVASNLCWVVGAQLDLRLTGIVTTVITTIIGVGFSAYVFLTLSRFSEDPAESKTRQQPLLAKTRYRDISTPVLDVVMLFSGQTMVIVLYMNEMCRSPKAGTHWFNSGLWTCGWVGQFMVYTQFGVDFVEEMTYWKNLLLRTEHKKLRIQKHFQTSIVADLHRHEIEFRAVLSCIANIIYRVFLWMSLPIYISRGHGGVALAMKIVAILYIMALTDVSVPVHIVRADRSDEAVFHRAQQVQRDEERPLRQHDADID